MRKRRVLTVVAAAAALGLTLAGCSNDSSDSSSSASPAAKGAVVVGSGGFTEIDIMASMYSQLLSEVGYTPEVKVVANREQYAPALSKGDIAVVPDYVGAMTDYLEAQKTGDPNARAATADLDASIATLTELAKDKGLVVLTPAKATNQEAYAVAESFAQEKNLTTLSDLGATNEKIVLAATQECETRPTCRTSLQKDYGIDITSILPFPYDSPQGKDQVKRGKAQLVQTSTVNTALGDYNLVILTDDKGIQPVQNLIPILNADSALASDQEVTDILAKLSEVLTTEDLGQLNSKVDDERQKVDDVAKEYLQSKGLIAS